MWSGPKFESLPALAPAGHPALPEGQPVLGHGAGLVGEHVPHLREGKGGVTFLFCTRCTRYTSTDCPTTNGGMQNGSSVGIRTCCVHVFARSAPIFMLSRCLLTEFCASELSRKFVKSVLLVGWESPRGLTLPSTSLSWLLCTLAALAIRPSLLMVLARASRTSCTVASRDTGTTLCSRIRKRTKLEAQVKLMSEH